MDYIIILIFFSEYTTSSDITSSDWTQFGDGSTDVIVEDAGNKYVDHTSEGGLGLLRWATPGIITGDVEILVKMRVPSETFDGYYSGVAICDTSTDTDGWNRNYYITRHDWGTDFYISKRVNDSPSNIGHTSTSAITDFSEGGGIGFDSGNIIPLYIFGFGPMDNLNQEVGIGQRQTSASLLGM